MGWIYIRHDIFWIGYYFLGHKRRESTGIRREGVETPLSVEKMLAEREGRAYEARAQHREAKYTDVIRKLQVDVMPTKGREHQEEIQPISVSEMPLNEWLFKPREVMAALQISRTTFYRHEQEGKIKSVRINGAIRIPKVEVDRLLSGTT
jgi:predicted DNA-binding transcriptional regulator AlpA